jgi:hypothetical protein
MPSKYLFYLYRTINVLCADRVIYENKVIVARLRRTAHADTRYRRFLSVQIARQVKIRLTPPMRPYPGNVNLVQFVGVQLAQYLIGKQLLLYEVQEPIGKLGVLADYQDTHVRVLQIPPYRAPHGEDGRLQPAARHEDRFTFDGIVLPELAENKMNDLIDYTALLD